MKEGSHRQMQCVNDVKVAFLRVDYYHLLNQKVKIKRVTTKPIPKWGVKKGLVASQ